MGMPLPVPSVPSPAQWRAGLGWFILLAVALSLRYTLLWYGAKVPQLALLPEYPSRRVLTRHSVELNTADSLTLLALPHIGPKLASRLLRYRRLRGPVHSLTELGQLRGFTAARLGAIDTLVFIDSTLLQPPKPFQIWQAPRNLNATNAYDLEQDFVLPFRLAGKLVQAGRSKGGFAGWDEVAKVKGLQAQHLADLQRNCYLGPPTQIALNTANLANLDWLPGVGPQLAQRILDYRAQLGWFVRTEQVRELKGIGPATWEKIKDRIVLGPHPSVPRLDINTSPLDSLGAHPYFDPWLLKEIEAVRQRGQQLDSTSLLQLRYMSRPRLAKLRPYVRIP